MIQEDLNTQLSPRQDFLHQLFGYIIMSEVDEAIEILDYVVDDAITDHKFEDILKDLEKNG